MGVGQAERGTHLTAPPTKRLSFYFNIWGSHIMGAQEVREFRSNFLKNHSFVRTI
jgi:hypothetical protein